MPDVAVEHCPQCNAVVDTAGVAPGGPLRCDRCGTRFPRARRVGAADARWSGRGDADGLGIHPALAKKYRERNSLAPQGTSGEGAPEARGADPITDVDGPGALPAPVPPPRVVQPPPVPKETRVLDEPEPVTTNPGRPVARRSLDGPALKPPPPPAPPRPPPPPPAAEPTPVIAGYVVGELIGKGAMGRVYKAVKEATRRAAAIKILAPELAARPDFIARFEREGAAMRAVQHPGVVTVLDAGAALQPDGSTAHYIAMEFVDGLPMRSYLEKGALAPEAALRFARLIIQGLGAAHARGVIHRDLKPENILISRGHALLADFGIARVTGDQARTQLTQDGFSLGTPAYMSPEMAAGEREVGPASDVYALGCILFELLTGAPPFTGDTYQAILVKRFTTDPPRVRTIRPEVPASCEEAIAKALAREPDRRFPTARAFGDALDAGSVPATPARDAPGVRSIVVLPFDNLSPDPNDAYLADGLTEELTADLSRVTALRVIARTSAVAARARTQDLKDIARLLDVRYLLEGSVRRAGTQLRITAQLIDGLTDAHLWAGKYGGTLDEVFEMQERISGSIVEELRARLTPDDSARAGPTTDPETYELYLRARHMLGQSLMRMPEATPLLEEVMRRDPAFAPAFCALGGPLVVCTFFGYLEPRSAWEKVQALADGALKANPRSGPAHELLAAVTVFRDWNWAEAKRLYARAAELEPGAGFDHFLHAFFLSFTGDKAAAVTMAERGRRLDPLSFIGFLTEAVVRAYARDFDTALPLAMRPIELDPQFPEGYHIAGYMHLGRKAFGEAADTLRQAVALSHRASWPMAKYGCALVGLGRVAEARALREELERRVATEPIISASAVATLCLHLGDHEAFYRWMHHGLDQRDPFALSLNCEFLWDPARGAPAFEELKRKVGLVS